MTNNEEGFSMNDFQSAVAVITGAASGLGKEFAIKGASLGMQLVLADVQEEALHSFLQELRASGARAVGMKVDVSNEADMQRLADLAINEFGQGNVLFNNAGVTSSGFVWENTPEDWKWVLNVNLFGVINGIRVFTPLMLEEAAKNPGYTGHTETTAPMADSRQHHHRGYITYRSMLWSRFQKRSITISRSSPAKLAARSSAHRTSTQISRIATGTALTNSRTQVR